MKKETPTQCFPVNIAKILRTAFFIQHLGWLLLLNENTIYFFGIQIFPPGQLPPQPTPNFAPQTITPD